MLYLVNCNIRDDFLCAITQPSFLLVDGEYLRHELWLSAFIFLQLLFVTRLNNIAVILSAGTVGLGQKSLLGTPLRAC